MYHKQEQSQWNNGWFANDLSWLNNPRAMHFSLWKPHRMRMECRGKVSSGRKDGMAGLVCCSMESSHHFIPLNQNPTFRKCHTVHNCPKLCCSCCAAWVRTISSSLLCLALHSTTRMTIIACDCSHHNCKDQTPFSAECKQMQLQDSILHSSSCVGG